jgi:hypothetical protein
MFIENVDVSDIIIIIIIIIIVMIIVIFPVLLTGPSISG